MGAVPTYLIRCLRRVDFFPVSSYIHMHPPSTADSGGRLKNVLFLTSFQSSDAASQLLLKLSFRRLFQLYSLLLSLLQNPQSQSFGQCLASQTWAISAKGRISPCAAGLWSWSSDRPSRKLLRRWQRLTLLS